MPKNKPVLFLSNHQNALLDVLLIGVDCNRKPWFLTRSDVFKRPWLKRFFDYLQMIPIYRIRDGRSSLKNNDLVFKKCAELLRNKEAILMFPEANHNLKRRVRPLSKGFTRILFGTLDTYPQLDIQLVPVGLNYKDAEGFPDRVGINFGAPIAVKDLYNKDDVHYSTKRVKIAVADSLKKLTTHIEDEENYEHIISRLDAAGTDFLKPDLVNKKLAQMNFHNRVQESRPKPNIMGLFFKFVFTLLNLPVVLLWRFGLKPKVWEPEFTGTLRFGYALLTSGIYCAVVFGTLALLYSSAIGLYAIVCLLAFNLAYVKLA